MQFPSSQPANTPAQGQQISKSVGVRAMRDTTASIESTNRYITSRGLPMDAQVVDHFLGVIQSGTYTDERYKVNLSRPLTTLTDTDALDLENDPVCQSAELTITATNEAEMVTHSHMLPAGFPVHVFAYVAEKTDGTTIHYYFTAAPPMMFPVKVEKDGGSNGNKTAAASWTYTVRDLNGNTLGTTIALTRPRPYGTATYQAGSSGYGVAFYDGTTLKLWDAGEIYGTGSC